MTKSHRSARLGLVCAVSIAACSSTGGGATTSAPDATAPGPLIGEAVVLVSTDGVVEIELPAGSVSEGSDLGIDIVDPAGVAGLEGVTPIGNAYRLRPEGITFADPLVLTFRNPNEGAGQPNALPLMITMIESGGALGAELEGFTEFSDAGDVVHRSTIDRFGTFVLLDGGVDLRLAPLAVADLEPGDTYVATLTATAAPTAIEPWPTYEIEQRWFASGGISEQSAGATDSVTGFGTTQQEWAVVNEYTCDVVGAGRHAVEISVEVADLPGGAQTREFLNLGGESTCGDVGR